MKSKTQQLENGNLLESSTRNIAFPTATPFRSDISLLRSFAILSVLGFHHFPSIFPFAFIGVDIFFVISGFLMFQIMKTLKNGGFHQIILSFYYRRLKRIIPLYYFILFFIGFSMLFIYTSIWGKQFFRFFFGAIFFYSNFQLLQADGDYFAENTEKLPFLHCWSLGVEMQFYLIAPFLFYIIKIKIKNLQLGHLILFSFFFSSFFFQIISSSIISFYHPFSRVWQFLCGGIVSLNTEKIRTTFPSIHSNLFSLISLIITLSIFLPFPPKIPPNLFQIFITITSTLFIFFATNCSLPWSSLPQLLHHISSISYCLYLVHFPILRFIEYLEEYHDINLFARFSSLFLTFLISSYLHDFFEKPLLQAKKLKIFLVTLKYFILCLLIGFKWEMLMHSEVSNEMMVENRKFLESLYKLDGGIFVDDGFMKINPPWGHYVYKGNRGHLKIVILGNSWAAQEAHLIRAYFPEENVSEMHLFSQPLWTFGLHGDQVFVKAQTPFFMKFLEELRPDYVFLIARYHDTSLSRDLTPFEGPNDTVLAEYLRGIRALSSFTKKLFIQTHQPFDCHGIDSQLLNRFLDSIQKGEDLTKFNRSFNITDFYNGSVYQRLRIVFEKCFKCYPIDIAEAFIDLKRNQLMTFDEEKQLLYFDNGCHLTRSGLKIIEKRFRESIENGINGVKNVRSMNLTVIG